MLKHLKSEKAQFLRYLMVGAWNTLFGYAVFAGLYFMLPSLHYIIILLAGNVISISNAYLCHKYFVFRTEGNYFREYARFFMVYGVTLLANMMFLAIFVEVLKLNPLAGQALIASIIVILGFLGNKYFSFA